MGKKEPNKKNTTNVNTTIHAPYNFVPFSNKIIQRYESMEELPSHGIVDPELKTGEIQVSIEAQTPIYIGDGSSEEISDFFRGADGEYQIPGSSVRGMLRETMQILGFGLVRPGEDVADYQIYFRDMASAKGSVAEELGDYYKSVMGITEKVTIPPNVKQGYLCCEKGNYYIKPSRCIRVSRQNPGMQAFKNEKGEVKPAQYFKVAYIEGEDEIKDIVPFGQKREGMKEGILLSTGRPVRGKPNHLYVFEKESESTEDNIFITKEDELSYKEDLEKRENSLKAYYEVDFWKMPEEGKSKPVFYLQYHGHTYFGMSLYVRIGYLHLISEGLPGSHQRKNEEYADGIFMDYPYAIMGFANKQGAYRSRVSVGNFKAEKEGKEKEKERTVITAEPKASYYAGYLNDGKNYNDDDFLLRGYKHYWLREKPVSAKELANESMQKKVRALGEGTVFRGVIRYKNLHEDELGLLLWALSLNSENDTYHSLGMGKPYGMGRVKIRIENLKELDASEFYCLQGLKKGLKKNSEKVDTYIKNYKEYAQKQFPKNKKKSIEEFEEIKDFFFMHQISPLKEKEMAYMELSEYKNNMGVFKTVKEIRKEKEDSEKEFVPKEQKKTKETAGGLDLSALCGKMRVRR